MSTTKKDQLILDAMNIVYTDVVKFQRDIAKLHTVLDTGMQLYECRYTTKPEFFIENLYQQCNEAHYPEGLSLDSQFADWFEEAAIEVVHVQRARVPMTLANARLAFLGKLKPFNFHVKADEEKKKKK